MAILRVPLQFFLLLALLYVWISSVSYLILLGSLDSIKEDVFKLENDYLGPTTNRTLYISKILIHWPQR